MAATVLQGSRGSANLITTENRAIRDVSPSMKELEPNEAPLTTIMSRLGAKSAEHPEFEWFEDELQPRFDVLNGALTAAATTMTVTNYKYFKLSDLVKIANKEIVRVTATPTSVTVSISRNFGEYGAVAASVGDQLQIIGSAFEEGSAKSAMVSTVRALKTNYAQIFKESWGFTKTEMATKKYAAIDKDDERRKKMIEHKRKIELAFWFGEQKKDTTTGTHPIRATRGIQKYIATNVKDAGGTLTEEEFEDWLRVVFRYGSQQKYVFCSPKVIQVINGFSRGKLETRTGEETYGVTMTKYQNAGRVVMLIEHKLFTNDSLNDLSGIAGYGICLDLADLELRYMRGVLSSLEENIETPGDDLVQHQYVSECGLQMSLEKKHGILTGVTD